MFNSSRSVEISASINENLPNNCYEETFSILDFSDLELLCGSPCLNENPIFPSLLEMPNTGTLGPKQPAEGVVEGPLTLQPADPPVAQLSPGVDFTELQFGSEWRLEAPLEAGGGPAEDFTTLLDPILDPGAEIDWKNQCSQKLTVVEPPVLQPQGEAVTAAWLTYTNVTIPREHLVSAGLLPEEVPLEDFVETEQQVSYDTAIPAAVENSLVDGEDSDYAPAATDGTNRKRSTSKSRKRIRPSVEPGTEEYKKKREQNNISVRKSREKSRKKQQLTEERVETLVAENNRLQERVDSLVKEVTILKGLFSNIGAALPPEVASFLSDK